MSEKPETKVEGIEVNVDLDPVVPTVHSTIVKLVQQYNASAPDDATSGWVSLKEINALIAGNPDATGIRIYFGRHDNGAGYGYAGLNTAIFVATKDTMDQKNPTYKYSKDLLDPTLTEDPDNTTIFTNRGDDRIPLCPPRCPIEKTDYIHIP
ncbi:hypothetical protein [Mucilaginibacter pedocola]|uniref:Uncharacterized protein n=1 Tax=Mucilaginibacter pedocola TaxID=1792845 RepID=A0A1S9PAI1_9SPHI|nr:hypothetical protein [Mucilaginibacter pedocola]OOQ57972.1 hypothetical protein BC343_09885 [Mucilaginibacter pedocola]